MQWISCYVDSGLSVSLIHYDLLRDAKIYAACKGSSTVG